MATRTRKPATFGASGAPPGSAEGSAPAGSARVHPPDIQKRIAETAYYLWEKRGRPHGQDVQLWLEAEKFVLRGQ